MHFQTVTAVLQLVFKPSRFKGELARLADGNKRNAEFQCVFFRFAAAFALGIGFFAFGRFGLVYRDVYFATIQRECHAAGLQCRSEPYLGPWKISEVIPFFDQVSGEFWTHGNNYSPWCLTEVVAGARANGANLISSEAFTGDPRESQWNETPEWLKAIGDPAFCDGVNRFMLHRFVHQPFDDRYQPGMAMGQWGTHFDRTQTWWEPGKAWVKYLQRCDALLQWGNLATNDFLGQYQVLYRDWQSTHGQSVPKIIFCFV